MRLCALNPQTGPTALARLRSRAHLVLVVDSGEVEGGAESPPPFPLSLRVHLVPEGHRGEGPEEGGEVRVTLREVREEGAVWPHLLSLLCDIVD